MPFQMQRIQRRKWLSTIQTIIMAYLASVIIATFILLLPFLHEPGVKLSFIDAFFTAVSAISVTGLTVVNTADTFNATGAFILTLFFQLGGIGIMSLGTFLWVIFGRQIGLEQRKMIAADHNRSGLAGLVRLMQTVLILAVVIEGIGTIVLATYFKLQGYFDSWVDSFYYGYFSALSAFTNAGFDLFGNSLIKFHSDYFIQIVHMILIILGAIGFPVLVEIKDYISNKGYKRKNYPFSLFTKVTTITFMILVIFGTIGFYIFERFSFLANEVWHEKLFYALFQSVSTRSGGMATLDISLLSEPTLLFMSLMMFIGASPSSVGGGIRTTTVAVMFLAVISFMRGRREVKVFKRELHPDDVLKAFIVSFVGVIIVVLSFFVLLAIEPFSGTQILFEVCSAFGTTGLSTGITADLTPIGKICIACLMFMGRIGIIMLLFSIKSEQQKTIFHYPKERIIIG